jgi:Mg2+ and Co2+ transporter CorA
LLQGVLDALADRFFPVLASFDDELDQLEAKHSRTPSDAQLGRLFGMKGR